MRFLPNYKKCFVCGDENPKGLNLRFYMDGDTARLDFTPSETEMGYEGQVHGGIISALLDETMGWAPCVLKKRFCRTAEISVRFLLPVPIGTRVTVIGRLVRDRGRVWETEGEVVDEQGTVYARAKGKYMPLSETETAAVERYLTYEPGEVKISER